MVFKKPYAFLIKHFKAIHLVLATLLVYLAFKIFKIVRFFSDFASSGYYTSSSNIAGSHINFFMYLVVLLILGISIFIYMLMRNKKKNTKYYMGLIAYYILVFVLLTVSYGIMQSLEQNVVDAQMARLYRDLSLLFSLPQYFFIIYTFIRGLGFNLKKFNFQLDLKEMEIEASDSEEVELTVGVESYKALRTLRRFLREFKYYFVENTFIFICIMAIIVLIIGTSVFMNINVYNKVYKEQKEFSYKVFNLKVNDSYITNTDFSGKEIIKNKYYLIVNMNIYNKSTGDVAIDLTDFRLKVNQENIYPTKSKGTYFADLGNPYKEDKIKGGSNKDYILVFELDKSYLRNNYIINILDSVKYNVGDIVANYKKVRVKPESLEKVSEAGSYKLQEEVNFKDSMLGNSTLKITGYNITNTYKYNYEFCVGENDCTTSVDIITPNYTKSSGTILMVLDYDLKLDETTNYYKNNKSANTFFSQFSKIRYKVGDETITESVTNLTPKNLTGKVVFQVDNQIRSSKNVDLVLILRNKEYTIKIK